MQKWSVKVMVLKRNKYEVEKYYQMSIDSGNTEAIIKCLEILAEDAFQQANEKKKIDMFESCS